jgi:hypothetical protein
MRKPISITIGVENLLWLKGQALATASGTVSGVIDQIITEARQGRARPGTIRSVVGSVRIPDDDPEMIQAKDDVRALVEASLSRSLTGPAASRTGHARRRAPRG